jgi:hypothetical protein
VVRIEGPRRQLEARADVTRAHHVDGLAGVRQRCDHAGCRADVWKQALLGARLRELDRDLGGAVSFEALGVLDLDLEAVRRS